MILHFTLVKRQITEGVPLTTLKFTNEVCELWSLFFKANPKARGKGVGGRVIIKRPAGLSCIKQQCHKH